MTKPIPNPLGTDTEYWARELVAAEREIRALREVADMLRTQLLADLDAGAPTPTIAGAVISVRVAHERRALDSKAVRALLSELGREVPETVTRQPRALVVRLQGE